MNIVSILITLAGIIAILALYIISKLSQQKQPKDQIIIIPKIHDDDGHLMSSIKSDTPATDGSTPPPIVEEEQEASTDKPPEKIEERQIVLFIASTNETGISGDDIPAVLEKHKLHFGEMDIFHYTIESEKDGNISLFRIANGVKPWTLVPDELVGTYTPGISIIMQLPSLVDDHSAIELFISHAEGIAKDLNAQLKNAQQEKFSDEDKKALLLSIS
ncbi:MAG TPA: hypothetical protein EYG68_03365 [Leucothrix mucor]|nr:hypothetical protein [Leucothrix mucor]